MPLPRASDVQRGYQNIDAIAQSHPDEDVRADWRILQGQLLVLIDGLNLGTVLTAEANSLINRVDDWTITTFGREHAFSVLIRPQLTDALATPDTRFTPPMILPVRVEHFTGRQEDLAEVIEILKGPEQLITLHGPGGIGKTSLVAEVVRMLAPDGQPPERFPDGIIFYSFYERPQIEVTMSYINHTFGVDYKNDPAGAAQLVLSQHKILLIFDNTEEVATKELRKLIDIRGKSSILMTTRLRKDFYGGQTKNINPLPLAEAMKLLQSLAGEYAADQTVIREICELVGSLPLAVSVVGNYLKEQMEDVSEYLDWLKESPFSALDQGEDKFESIKVLLDQSITRLSADARQVLQAIGFLALAPFERKLIAEIVTRHRPNAITEIRHSIDELVNYSLLSPLGKSQYKLSHPLIHRYIREASSRNTEIEQAFVENVIYVLNEMFPENNPEGWHAADLLIPHIHSMFRYEGNRLDLPRLALLFNRAGEYLHDRARYIEAESLLDRSVAIREKVMGSEHPDTATSLYNLGSLYSSEGRYEKAEPLLEKVLGIREKVLGSEHPDTAGSMNSLGVLYRRQGKYDQAIPFFEQAIGIRMNVLGVAHVDTGISLTGLATVFAFQGKYDLAEPLLQQALAIFHNQAVVNHPAIAYAMNNLGQLYSERGRYEEAESLLKQAVVIRQKVLGPEHPRTALSMNDLAWLYHKQNRFSEAEPLYEQVLAIRKKVLGPLHPETVSSLANLGNLYVCRHRYEEAEFLLKEALSLREKLLGSEHPDTATSLHSLAHLYVKQEKYDQAGPLYERALAIQKEALGPAHPGVATTLESLATMYLQELNNEKAAALYEEALAIREKVLGSTHPDTLQTKDNLAALLKSSTQ